MSTVNILAFSTDRDFHITELFFILKITEFICEQQTCEGKK